MADRRSLRMYKILVSREGLTTTFRDVVNYLDSQNQVSATGELSSLASLYQASLDGHFFSSRSGNRAITVPVEEIDVRTNDPQRSVFGFIDGGLYGGQFRQRDVSTTQITGEDVLPNAVLCQYHYFSMFLTLPSNIGFVVLQDNGQFSKGISSAFFQHLADFLLNNGGFKLTYTSHTAQSMTDAFFEGSNVVELHVIDTVGDSGLGIRRGVVKPIRVTRKIDKIKLPYSVFFQNWGRLSNEVRSVFGENIPEDRIMVTFRNHGKNITCGVYNLGSPNLAIEIPDYCYEGQDGNEILTSIHRYVSENLLPLLNEGMPNGNR